jgi:hypothetical protein
MAISSICPFFFFFCWDWDLNSRLHTYKIVALPLEPHMPLVRVKSICSPFPKFPRTLRMKSSFSAPTSLHLSIKCHCILHRGRTKDLSEGLTDSLPFMRSVWDLIKCDCVCYTVYSEPGNPTSYIIVFHTLGYDIFSTCPFTP